MGGYLSVLYRMVYAKKNVRIVMLGLDGAGKTTILYKLKLGELVTTIPTIGFNVEQVQYGMLTFTIWDVGGQTKIRPLWKYYFQNTQALIYVVDSADVTRLQEAREELQSILEDPEMRDVKILVFANKQDLPYAATPGELTEKLGLMALRGREWYIQASNATTADGLMEGLEWLEKQLR